MVLLNACASSGASAPKKTEDPAVTRQKCADALDESKMYVDMKQYKLADEALAYAEERHSSLDDTQKAKARDLRVKINTARGVPVPPEPVEQPAVAEAKPAVPVEKPKAPEVKAAAPAVAAPAPKPVEQPKAPEVKAAAPAVAVPAGSSDADEASKALSEVSKLYAKGDYEQASRRLQDVEKREGSIPPGMTRQAKEWRRTLDDALAQSKKAPEPVAVVAPKPVEQPKPAAPVAVAPAPKPVEQPKAPEVKVAAPAPKPVEQPKAPEVKPVVAAPVVAAPARSTEADDASKALSEVSKLYAKGDYEQASRRLQDVEKREGSIPPGMTRQAKEWRRTLDDALAQSKKAPEPVAVVAPKPVEQPKPAAPVVVAPAPKPVEQPKAPEVKAAAPVVAAPVIATPSARPAEVETASKTLSEVSKLYAKGEYAEAGRRLQEVEKSGGNLPAGMVSQSKEWRATLQGVETQAEKDYAEILKAFEAKDYPRTRKLLAEFKVKHAKTGYFEIVGK